MASSASGRKAASSLTTRDPAVGNGILPPPGDIVVSQVALLSGVLASTGATWSSAPGSISITHQRQRRHGNNRIRHVVVDDGYKVDKTVRLTEELIDRQQAVALIGLPAPPTSAKC